MNDNFSLRIMIRTGNKKLLGAVPPWGAMNFFESPFENDEDDSTVGQEFDLDHDDISEKPELDMRSLGRDLPSHNPSTRGSTNGGQNGFGDVDPSAMEELMGLMNGGQPDPVRIRRILKANPSLQAMMEQVD